MTEQSKGAVRLVWGRVIAESATVTAETLELLEQQVGLLPEEDFSGADADVGMLATLRLKASPNAAKQQESDVDCLDTPAIRAAIDNMRLSDLNQLGGLEKVRRHLWPTQ